MASSHSRSFGQDHADQDAARLGSAHGTGRSLRTCVVDSKAKAPAPAGTDGHIGTISQEGRRVLLLQWTGKLAGW